MPLLPPPFKIDPMVVADIPAVVAIEHLAYSMTWPARAYGYELTQNNLAHYFVLRTLPSTNREAAGRNQGQAANIIGLAGFWLMADEAHINTIAIHPDWRGLGLGELLLLHLIETGQALGAAVATLEVRPSNLPALGLYHKYGFAEVGRRRHYYSDNDEDALILTTPPLALSDYQTGFEQHRETLHQRLVILGDKLLHLSKAPRGVITP